MPVPAVTAYHRVAALVRVGRFLSAHGYRFVTPTPETHRRVNARFAVNDVPSHRDIFGWSRAFDVSRVDPELRELCQQADILTPHPSGGVSSAVRFSTLACAQSVYLLVHSAYPTDSAHAVFFGPDSYRFVSLLGRTQVRGGRVVDVGCGTGIGGLSLQAAADELVLADVNQDALACAAVNLELAALNDGPDDAGLARSAYDRSACRVVFQKSDVLGQVEGPIDTLICNPPYLADSFARVYRDGGGALGTAFAMRVVREGMERLAHHGQLILYTGTPVVNGEWIVQAPIEALLKERGARWTWDQIDPDVFGEELERDCYAEVERIAAVSLVATVP